MALLDDVKSELAAIDNELPAAKKAQATAMIRFGGGLRLVQRQIIVQAQFDSLKAAQWLQDTIRDLYGHEAVMTQVSRSTPNGATVQRYMIHVERGGAALALQTGLLDRRKRLVRGLPADIISGNIAQVKAAWRGAFLAHGALSDPGKAGFLEIICPSNEAALALSGAARRLGITAKPRQLRSSERITLKDPDNLEATSVDIAENPHNLQFVEVEAAAVPRQLQDVDFAVINGNYAIEAGFHVKDAVAVESKDGKAVEQYANYIVTTPDKKDDDRIAALVSVLTSDDFKQYLSDTYGQDVLPAF